MAQYHYDPKGHEAGQMKDFQNDMGLGSDIIHLAQMGWRVLVWPVRLLLRPFRGGASKVDELDAGERPNRPTIRPRR